MQTYEVEVKALLGSPQRAEEIRSAMKKVDASCTLLGKNKQLNHYFEKGDLHRLQKVITPHLSTKARERLENLVRQAKSFSVRTRDKDGEVLIVIKAAADDTTSQNGIVRIEFEEKMPMTLRRLDDEILRSGFAYQAKWSREREEYVCRGINVTLDKNAGYGWLAEFEKLIDDPDKLDQAKEEIRALMSALGVDELPQDRLERMFAFYNANWPKFYGTDNIFVVE